MLTAFANLKIKEESVQTEQPIDSIKTKIEELFSKFEKLKKENNNC